MTIDAALHAAGCEREALPCLCCAGRNLVREDVPRAPAAAGDASRHRRSAWIAAIAAALLLAFCVGIDRAHAADLPGDSTYHLALPLVDQDGKGFTFADGRGRPRIVSMFYARCKYVCPLIIDTLLKTERALDPRQRAGLDVLIVSLDPETDTPEVLRRVADKRKLDTPRWRLARTNDAGGVRQLAAVLGVRYKQLEDREFSHSSALVLLDAEGRIVARSDRMGEVDPEFLAALRAQFASP